MNKKRFLVIAVVVSLLSVLAVGSAEGAVITVKADGTGDYPTIQAAINNANEGDEVVCADGIYTGVGNRGIDFLGKAITVRSENGPGSCIIDCSSLGNGFRFDTYEEASSVVEGFTIRNIVTGIGWLEVNLLWHPLLFKTYGGDSYRFYFNGTGTIGGRN